MERPFQRRKTKLEAFHVLICCLALGAMEGCENRSRVETLLSQGAQAQQKEDYQQAIKDYSDAIKLDPRSATAFASRGSVFASMGEFDKGLADLDEAIRLNPNDAYSREMRGYVWFGKGDFVRAISDLDEALRIDPKEGRILKMRGKVSYWKGDYTNAIVDLTEALKFFPDDSEIFDDRGGAHHAQKQFDQAMSDYSQAVLMNPKDTFGLYGRARIYYRTGRYAEALRDLEATTRLKSNVPGALNLLAWLLATCPRDQLRDGKRAVRLASEACELSKWKNYAYIDTLAAAHAEAGDFEAAVKFQKQAASMNGVPENNRTNVANRLELYLHHQPAREDASEAATDSQSVNSTVAVRPEKE
jgi:Tfp pilus assembly protein PilF